MHPCLCVEEIVRLIAHELVADEQNRSAVAMACCCKHFEDPALDALWMVPLRFINLLDTLPGDIWSHRYKVGTATITPVFLLLNPLV